MRVAVTDEQIRVAFEAVRHDGTVEESRALYEQGHRPTEMVQAMALRPEILRAFGQFGSCVYPGGRLEQRLKELVIVEASRLNGCQFCRDSHVAVMKMLRMSGDPLADLDRLDALPPREQLAVEYTREVTRDANRVPDGLFTALHEVFTEPEIVELTFLIGFINMLNLFNNALRVTYRGEYEGLASQEPEAGSQEG